ncbi:MAG: polysaccharide biosynthesis tyrosine autokinase [Phycisphaerae bacterium]|nr:polysaccharide biosynthesis tyrosine autokinase [Phycisphaerae bacterium]
MASSSTMPSMLPYGEPMPPAPYTPPQVSIGDDAPTMNAGDFWRIVKQRKWTIVLTFVLLYLLVILATFITFRFYPAYPAQALLELQSPDDPGRVVNEQLDPDRMQMLLETEAQKIRQPSVFENVLRLDEIKQTSFYQYYKSFDECLEDLKDLLSVGVIPDSRLIRVSIDLRNKDDAVKVVKAIVDEYVKRYATEDTSGKQIRLDELQRRRDTIKTEANNKQKDIEKFVAQYRVPSVPQAGGATIEQVRVLATELNVLYGQKRMLEVNYDQLKAIKNPDLLPLSGDDILIIESDPQLRFNRQQVELLEIQIEALTRSGRVGPNHREIQTLQAQRDEYFQKEVAKREELIQSLRQRKSDQLVTQLEEVTAIITQYQERLDEAQSKQQDIDNNMVVYRSLLTEHEQLQEQLGEIEKMVNDARTMADAAPRRRALAVWQNPRPAVWPSRPNFLLFLGGGLLFSGLAAFGLAFLRELSDQAVRTPRDIVLMSRGQFPVLGTIPLIDDEQADIEDIEQATRAAPQSLVAESFRQVRAQLMLSGPSESQRVVLITSSGPGDGTTACAINLAVTFAQTSQRVLLIDCNFRRPALRAAFRNTKSDGLSNVLIGQKRLADVISQTEIPNLDVVTSGPMPPTPAELLGSSYMAEALRDAAAHYDRIILDGPPSLLFSDSLVLATLVDAVIVVARAVSNSKGELRRARDQLVRVGGRVVGCILNGVQARAGGYFKNQYREFYDYTSDEVVPQELPGGGTTAPSDGANSGTGKPPESKPSDED